MVTIEITKRGVIGLDGKPIPVGKRLEMEVEPTNWRNKYRVVNSGGSKVTPATPAKSAKAATNKKPAAAWPAQPPVKKEAESELDKLRAEYQELTGKPAPGVYKETGLIKAIEAIRNGSNN